MLVPRLLLPRRSGRYASPDQPKRAPRPAHLVVALISLALGGRASAQEPGGAENAGQNADQNANQADPHTATNAPEAQPGTDAVSPPQLLHRVDALYPTDALREEREGRVELLVTVDAD